MTPAPAPFANARHIVQKLSCQTARQAAQKAESWRRVAPSPLAPLGLTAHEEEVLRNVAAGFTNRQIAKELFVSERTAGVHVLNILRKVKVSNRVQAAAVAHQLLTESTDR